MSRQGGWRRVPSRRAVPPGSPAAEPLGRRQLPGHGAAVARGARDARGVGLDDLELQAALARRLSELAGERVVVGPLAATVERELIAELVAERPGGLDVEVAEVLAAP